MTDENALLSTIAGNPDDDMPRLVYADWLEEHDKPVRAEFIRLECQIARIQLLPRAELDHYVDLFKRDQELRDDHWQELLGPLAALRKNIAIEFRRGFVSLIRVTLAEFLRHAEAIATARPLPAVQVRRVGEQIANFLNSPHLETVTHISGYPEEPVGAVSFNATMLASVSRLKRLESLDLEGCRIDDSHCELAGEISIPSLVDLDLSNNAITDEGITALLRTRLPGQLRRLVLGGNPITDRGAVELAERWPVENKLKNLNLRFTALGARAQQALLNRFGGIVDLF